ncbi:peptidylprolyl isomerase [Streptomyces sp. CC228A]|uniref:peptidylprolyl isomerase n=1 Tax=Streptomyces sp. CC228A TaxID=2898186 RepID=UPI001F31614F|nr:peptidylprolyl isomerase [Streptomyces sp. CC228A]
MVSSDQRRRQAARKRYERQQQRRREAQQKARRRNAVIAGALTVVLAASAGAYASGVLGGGKEDKAAAGASGEPTPSAPEKSPEPSMAIDTKAAYTMALKTNHGDITIAMDAAKAPRTVNSFSYLAGRKFFDDTTCHRLTTKPASIFVLQCGDPEGTGYGNPGYELPDENLDSLGKAGADGMVTYKAGTVAMANSGPNTAGSQFFLVYEDSKLPPGFTPFGTMDEAGLKAVRKVAEGGAEGSAGDGAPKKPVTIEQATVTRK